MFERFKRIFLADGPAVRKIEPERVQKVIGISYSDVASGLANRIDTAMTNPDLLQRYYRQLEDDETIGTGLGFLVGAAVKQIGAYTHPDPKIQDLIRLCREKIKGTLEASRQELLQHALAHGYAVSEFTLCPVSGRWALSGLYNYDPMTTRLVLGQMEDNSYGIKSIQQIAAGRTLEIPREKAIVFQYGRSSSPYGKSRLRLAYRWWEFKKAIFTFWALGLERYSSPTAWGQTDGGAEEVRILTEALGTIHNMGYVVTGTNDRVSFLERNGQGAKDCKEALEFANSMIYRSLFLPPLLGGGENGGSYSLGQVHLEMFQNAVEWLAQLVVENELEQLWRPVIEWNFGPQEDYGTMPLVDNTTPEEKKVMSEVLLNMVNAGFVDPATDTGWVRELLGFPEAEEGMEPWQARSLPPLPTV
jgi:hypothetical protein